MIKKYIKGRQEVAARKKAEGDSDFEDEASYIRCPVSLQVIDHEVMVPNIMLK